jgi:4a-hydroxytetrahydrobiopterin dehydratase
MERVESLRPLDEAEIAAALEDIEGWTHDPDRSAIVLHLEMRDFAGAFGLMSEIAIMAERADHHPEWANVYNRLDIWLTTHDVSGVSARDLAMARQISDAVARRK